MMPASSFARILLPASLLLVACPRPPGEESTDQADDQGNAEALADVPDLPCGGADFSTDDRNCGACGNECEVAFPSTQYAAGGCSQGECGPIWNTVFTLPAPPDGFTCDFVCGTGGRECAERGCAGLTGYVCVNIGDFGSQCDLGNPSNVPRIEMTGDCDELAPYPNDAEPGDFVYLGCCCERG